MRRTNRAIITAAAVTGLAAVAGAAPAQAQYPGENGRVSFIQQVMLEVPCFTGFEGEGPAPFTDAGAGSIAYSPDGREVAVTTEDGLWVVVTADCTARELASGSFTGLAWSPDGDEIAVGGSSLQVLDAATGTLLRTIATGTNPTWSPNGSKIAYERPEGVWVAPSQGQIRPDGTTVGAKLLVPGAGQPDYSPDGKRIAYVRDERIAHAKVPTGAREVVLDEYLATDVVWSPDGRFFLYAGGSPSRPDDNADCQIMTVSGVHLSTVEAEDPCWAPAWQPLAAGAAGPPVEEVLGTLASINVRANTIRLTDGRVLRYDSNDLLIPQQGYDAIVDEETSEITCELWDAGAEDVIDRFARNEATYSVSGTVYADRREMSVIMVFADTCDGVIGPADTF
ncbi:hypothetical protein [uncultured Cellulomonas sp.]|uniref:hypothetical protein n=1 Tax=uncultured Cellulomonas sp. TaxID=189682 RepID=UPI0026339862|nr:hypothetical protein [uncultured Cellulomonas sp.]